MCRCVPASRDGLRIQVKGIFEGTDVEHTVLFCSQLQTPTGVFPAAVLRMGDVRMLEFPVVGSERDGGEPQSTE